MKSINVKSLHSKDLIFNLKLMLRRLFLYGSALSFIINCAFLFQKNSYTIHIE